MPPKRKEKKRKEKEKQNYIPKCAECEGWRLWWRLEFDIRAAQSSPSMTSRSFLPSPRLVYSFTLRTAELRATCSSTALQSPSYTYPSCSLRNLFSSPQLLLDPLRTPNSPSPTLPTYFDLFPGGFIPPFLASPWLDLSTIYSATL